MRVIAGALGGRRLKAPPGTGTRPTSDRVREAVFAMLGEIAQARVLDLFAGSGALGIEALSRGAASVVFVERDARAARVLEQNLDALEIPRSAVRVRRADALDALREAGARQEVYDLVFIDPPYGRARRTAAKTPIPAAERWGPSLSAILPSLLSKDGRVVVESDRRAPIELAVALERTKRYGDTSITIHRRQ